MVALALAGMLMSVRGGELDAPAAPTNTASAMFTLNDIYNKLNTRTNVTKRTGAFTEPTGGPTNGTMHTLNDIMALVTNRAPVPKTGKTTSGATYDDGELRKGVAWPNPRFTIQANTNVVMDNLTGLMWTRNANLFGVTNWGVAVTNCNNMNTGPGTYGYTDWRLPNVRELQSLIDYGRASPALCDTTGTNQWTENDPFTGVQSARYWASTQIDASVAWSVSLANGLVGNDYPKSLSIGVWPARGGGD